MQKQNTHKFFHDVLNYLQINIITTNNNRWCTVFTVIAVVLFFALTLLSLDTGNTGDEDSFQIPQGEYVLNYFKTGGQDTTCLSFQNLKYYGSSFDVVTAFINHTLHIENINISRHVCNRYWAG